ncbi:hypothetical protein SAMN05216327_109192 [Dyadobacter sp. SG02]|uniref:hypothetical protein n=1 Tax=Dyadobacter sp. SG02 TaxID=1855291 RepID=UPI0008AD5FFB|nr:hypothetical protein [Dyadobacter sp. SG02]SEJ38933.1 hypothetical protein SAMN05216327_109192 [Dyadobacter sp. SG02]
MENLLIPPSGSVTVRMYRQGHGDCFLLAFDQENSDRPFYVVIDCGYKPGSQNFIHKDESGAFANGPSIREIVDHIALSTDSHLDLFIVTHEHQDHLNGIWKETNPFFENFTIDKAWFAWTEDPSDELANKLRKKHRDQLLGLVGARNKLSLTFGADHSAVERLDELLSLEIGGHEEKFAAGILGAAADPAQSDNKQSMKLVKDKALANNGVEFLRPGDLEKIGSAADPVKVYVLGPPQSETLLADEDPVGNESFPNNLARQQSGSFMAAVNADPIDVGSPFDSRFQCSFSDEVQYIENGNIKIESFLQTYYGDIDASPKPADSKNKEVEQNAEWRRIDNDWLLSSENLAIKLNTGINNTSLVLAFELPKSKKVLFFAGDAQRGNWISWADMKWGTGQEETTTKDILSRAVLYKAGHHGSHNATLSGQVKDKYANLSWMGQGKYAREFTAMITAVNTWAITKNRPPWRHPLPAIKKALEEKCSGRVFQTDVPVPAKPNNVSDTEWQAFVQRMKVDRLYFDYTIADAE